MDADTGRGAVVRCQGRKPCMNIQFLVVIVANAERHNEVLTAVDRLAASDDMLLLDLSIMKYFGERLSCRSP